MRRREFITLLGGGTLAWPLRARAQQPERRKRIGVLMGLANDAEGQARLASFVRGLEDLGWVNGRNVQIEIRWASGQADAAATYAAELAGLAPDVILTATTAAFAAMQLKTQSIPIVFVQVVEPVKSGLVTSLARPGGNSTGFTSFEYAMTGKWLATIKELVPDVDRVAVVHSPEDPGSAGYLREGEPLARVLGVELVPVGGHEIAEVERLLGEFASRPNGGLIALPNAFTAAYREQIVALAAKYHLPAVYPLRYFSTSGGLVIWVR
jgi:putative tryptophan/tyrosine transport system substrate-binding protein